MHHSNTIEGVHPIPELRSLFRRFVSEAVPPAVSDVFVDRYMRKCIIGMAPFVEGPQHASR